jgi:nucleotide-binding universal stress UspA family protein
MKGSTMYRHILFATDGSELADRASRHAFQLAKALGVTAAELIAEPEGDES